MCICQEGESASVLNTTVHHEYLQYIVVVLVEFWLPVRLAGGRLSTDLPLASQGNGEKTTLLNHPIT